MDKYILDITLGDQDYIAPLGFEVMSEIKREEKGDPCHLIASNSKRLNVIKEYEYFIFIRFCWVKPYRIASRLNLQNLQLPPPPPFNPETILVVITNTDRPLRQYREKKDQERGES